MRTYEIVLKDPKKMSEMLDLRRQGWSLKTLALIYNVDHSSIYKACKIRKIHPTKTLSLDIPFIVSKLEFKSPEPKMYQDYLEEQRRRRLPRLYHND